MLGSDRTHRFLSRYSSTRVVARHGSQKGLYCTRKRTGRADGRPDVVAHGEGEARELTLNTVRALRMAATALLHEYLRLVFFIFP